MAGFLGRTRNDEEPPDGQDEDSKQEAYEQVLPKIADNFLDKDDFVVMMQKLMEIIDPDGRYQLDWTFNENAQRKLSEIE